MGFFDLPHTMMEELESEIESLRLSGTKVRTAISLSFYVCTHTHIYIYIHTCTYTYIRRHAFSVIGNPTNPSCGAALVASFQDRSKRGAE